MKFVVWSDLHLDVWPEYIRHHVLDRFHAAMHDAETYDVIIAGDIHNGPGRTEEFLEDLRGRGANVVFVKGNHDHYGVQVTNERGVDYGSTSLGGVQVDYATLWTNFRDEPAWKAGMTFNRIADSFNIKKDDRYLRAQDVINMNYDQMSYISASRAPVIVTHFPMFRQSIHERFQQDPLNGYFVNDYDPFYAMGRKLIVHGHVHNAFDYELEGARVVCHPLGYPGENSGDQHFPKIVEIDVDVKTDLPYNPPQQWGGFHNGN